jgi:uncharacterized protein YcgI (DUF1989 family)
MKRTPQSKAPVDADARRAIKPVICYPIDTLPLPNMTTYAAAREAMKLMGEVIVPPRDARAFRVSAGNLSCFCREFFSDHQHGWPAGGRSESLGGG